jgi:hypothetical protein
MPFGSTAPPPSPANLLAYRDPIARSLGLLAASGELGLVSTSFVIVSQTIQCSAVWLNAGDVVNNVMFNVATGGAGTAPTGIFVGLCDATTMRAQSGNLAANVQWTTGSAFVIQALSAPYTAQASALHYVMFLQNGAWGTTQMTLNRLNNLGAQQPSGGSTFIYATAGTGQTALPANNTPVTLAAAGAANLLVGVS